MKICGVRLLLMFTFDNRMGGRTPVCPVHECLDWQPSQFINIVGKDDVNPAGLDSNKERLREVST